MELALNINNNLREFINNIGELQERFLESNFYKILNSGLDLGIQLIMPDIIQDQLIDIKNAIFEGGLKNGVNTLVENLKDFGKSALGIVTGNFENISQIQIAVKKGGIIDSISNLIDKALDKASKNGKINSNIKKAIKNSKNSILKTINDSISESLDNQVKYLEKVDEYNNKWQEYFNNKDFEGMEKAYKNLKKYIEKCIPLEKTITTARKIENIHSMVKKNNGDFNISSEELELLELLK